LQQNNTLTEVIEGTTAEIMGKIFSLFGYTLSFHQKCFVKLKMCQIYLWLGFRWRARRPCPILYPTRRLRRPVFGVPTSSTRVEKCRLWLCSMH